MNAVIRISLIGPEFCANHFSVVFPEESWSDLILLTAGVHRCWKKKALRVSNSFHMTVMNRVPAKTNVEDMTHFPLVRAAALSALSSEGIRETERGCVLGTIYTTFSYFISNSENDLAHRPIRCSTYSSPVVGGDEADPHARMKKHLITRAHSFKTTAIIIMASTKVSEITLKNASLCVYATTDVKAVVEPSALQPVYTIFTSLWFQAF